MYGTNNIQFLRECEMIILLYFIKVRKVLEYGRHLKALETISWMGQSGQEVDGIKII